MRSKRKPKTTQAVDRVLDDYANEIRNLGKQTVENVIRMGKLLVLAKKRVGHGGWLNWLEKEFGWSVSSAEAFIRVYKFSRTATFAKIQNMTSPSLLAELAKRSTGEAARTEIIQRINAGERVSVADVRPARVRIRESVLKVNAVGYVKESTPAPSYVYKPEAAANREADTIIQEIGRLFRSIAEKFSAASDVTHIVERVNDRGEFAVQLDELTEFLALLKEACGVSAQPPMEMRPPEMPSDDGPTSETMPSNKTKH